MIGFLICLISIFVHQMDQKIFHQLPELFFFRHIPQPIRNRIICCLI